MSLSIYNAQRKRESILQTAEELFLQQGYGITRMDMIAEQAGMTKQTIYRYFPSKESLFIAVMQSVREKYNNAYVFSSQTVEQELQHYGEYVLAFHLHSSALGLYRLMISEGIQENLTDIFSKNGPGQIILPLAEFLQQRYPDQTEWPFCAQMFINMVLAPRNQILMGVKKAMSQSAQKEHIHKVVKYFLKMMAP